MDASSVWGLTSVSIICGSLAGALFRRRRTRLVVATTAAILASAPTLFGVVSVAERVFAFWDVPAIATIFLTVYFCVVRKRPDEDADAKAETSRLDAAVLPRKFWRGALISFGALLYASEFNFFVFDVYRLGYASFGVLAAVVAIILTSDRSAAILTAVAATTTFCGLYSNVFDAILDFGVWTALVVSAFVDGVLRLRTRRDDKRERRANSEKLESNDDFEKVADSNR